MKRSSLLVLAVLSFFASQSFATVITTDSGFSGSDPWVMFNENYAAGTAIAGQYNAQGVNFGGTGVFNFSGNPSTYSSNPNFSGGYLDNFTGVFAAGGESYEIIFNMLVSQAGAWWEFNASSPAALFSAYLGNTFVESYVYNNASCCSTTEFIGFAGSFDRIVISNISGVHFIMDNLRYTPAVPAPAPFLLLITGMLLFGFRKQK